MLDLCKLYRKQISAVIICVFTILMVALLITQHADALRPTIYFHIINIDVTGDHILVKVTGEHGQYFSFRAWAAPILGEEMMRTTPPPIQFSEGEELEICITNFTNGGARDCNYATIDGGTADVFLYMP